MRTTILGLTVPLLLLTAAFAMAVPQAAAQTEETYEVSGRVTSDDGTPLEGVRVNGYTSPETKGGTAYNSVRNSEATTDADGHYALKLAAGRGYINVYYDAWRQGDSREIVVGNDTAKDVSFTLKTPPPKNAIISGTILGPDGKPVENAEVQLRPSYSCCVRYAEPVAVEAAPAPTPTQPPTEGNTTSADAAPPATTEPAEPKSDAMATRMMMPPYGYDDYQSAVTGADGRFSFKGYEGPRTVTAWAKGFAQTTLEVTAVANGTTDVEIRLEKVPAKDAIVMGRVINRETGLPISNAHVSVRSLEWGRWAEGVSGKDGTYRVATVPGWTEISINVWDSGGDATMLEGDTAAREMSIAPRVVSDQYYSYSLVLDLKSGDNTHDAELDPKPKPTLALIGYVIDPAAKSGVEGVHVNVWNQQTGDWGEAVTDATGSFKIIVSPGHYSANAWKEGYLSGTQTFLVTGESVQRLDLVMPKGTTKYAPCYDDDCGGPIMYYASDASKSSDGTSSASAGSASAPVPAPEATSTPTSSADTAAPQMAGGGAQNAQSVPAKDRPATLSGSGGGLPPYDPNAPATTGTTKEGTGTSQGTPTSGLSEVPGLGLVALLGIAAASAVVLRRRR